MKIKGSNILITGGTGSFGHRMAARINKVASSVTIFSRDEKKQWNMKKDYFGFEYIIGDVRDINSVNEAMKGIDIVFNAAALKQVPSCETFVEEAIKTNVLGAINVCRSAIENRVGCVVGLSTDKAVKPINAMGMSKALMEKILCNYGRKEKYRKNTDKNSNRKTIFCCVRYGNVMGSRGSVIPLFKEQIKNKNPVTVTVPEMTRFMLTLDQAIDLVLYAIENAQGGEIFVKKAPACRMDFLAQSMIQKYGNNNNNYFDIIGIRAGEKLHETLINEYEMLFTKELDDHYVIENSNIEEKIINSGIISVADIKKRYKEYTSNNTKQITDYNEISDLLDKVIDEDIE